MKISIRPNGSMEIADGNFTASIPTDVFGEIVDVIYNNLNEVEFDLWMSYYGYVPEQTYLDMKYERDSWEEKYNELSKAYEDVEKERDEWESRYKDLT